MSTREGITVLTKDGPLHRHKITSYVQTVVRCQDAVSALVVFKFFLAVLEARTKLQNKETENQNH
jgi:hypothetical protein